MDAAIEALLSGSEGGSTGATGSGAGGEATEKARPEDEDGGSARPQDG
jgi:hypothetical protein